MPKMKLNYELPLHLVLASPFSPAATEITALELISWAKKRVFPKERVDGDKLLDMIGLDDYNEWEIAKFTRATSIGDTFWLAIEEGDTYEKCSLRYKAGYKKYEWDKKEIK